MKVCIVAPSAVPYTVGGAERLWWGLLESFRRHTSHQVELLKIPSPERDFAEVVASYRRFAELDLSHFDLLISTKYPAWMVRHHNHYVYLQHTLRGLYDTYPAALPPQPEDWPPELEPLRQALAQPPAPPHRRRLFAELEALLDTPLWQQHCVLPSPLARQVVHWLDRSALQPAAIKKFMAISANIAGRADYFPPGVPVQVIHHPSGLFDDALAAALAPGGSAPSQPPTPPDSGLRPNDDLDASPNDDPDAAPTPGLPATSPNDDLAASPPAASPNADRPTPTPYLLAVSRLEPPKRLDLLIHAMQRVDAPIELWIAGDGPQQPELQALAATDPRVRLLGRVADPELRRLYAAALAVAFVPADEDYGLVTLEALQAGKPVLSCEDSGGVAELVEHQRTGWLCAPRPDALADHIQQLALHPERARAMRPACLQRGRSIHWQGTLEALLDQHHLLDNDGYLQRGKPTRLVVAVSFAVWPPRSGGQQRVYHLYRHIAAFTPVTLVTLGSHELPLSRREIAPGLTEIRVPKSAPHARAEAQLEAQLGVSVGDVYVIDNIHQTPQYLHELREACRHAQLAVASHPYLYRALRAVYRGPLYYESHNVEADLKAELLGPRAAAQPWLHAVRQVEAECAAQARGVAVCTEDDARRMAELYQLPAARLALVPNGAVAHRPVLQRADRLRLRRRLLLGSRPVALFLGSWHGPNLDAVDFIIRQLAPALPHLDFWLLGGVCDALRHRDHSPPAATPGSTPSTATPGLTRHPASLSSPAPTPSPAPAPAPTPTPTTLPPNVRTWGKLDEPTQWTLLQAADLALNPASSGAGSSLKMIEYSIAGLPVLSTPHGCRGLAPELAKCLHRAELEDFEKKLSELVNLLDTDAFQHLSAKALAASADGHVWQGIAKSYYGQIVSVCLN